MEKVLPRFQVKMSKATSTSDKGSPIFNLLISTLPVISNQLNWITSNGKFIKIWEDFVLGQDFLSLCMDLAPLRIWMLDHGISSLFNISSWDPSSRSWIGWNLAPMHPPLEPLSSLLLHTLNGCAPRNLAIKDSQGWGVSLFSVKKRPPFFTGKH